MYFFIEYKKKPEKKKYKDSRIVMKYIVKTLAMQLTSIIWRCSGVYDGAKLFFRKVVKILYDAKWTVHVGNNDENSLKTKIFVVVVNVLINRRFYSKTIVEREFTRSGHADEAETA